MWTIIKFDTKKLASLKEDLKLKLGKNYKIYIPKIKIQKYKNNKLISKEVNLLGDYLFCFHNEFKSKKILTYLKFTKGVKYFLEGYVESQKDIENFLTHCSNFENKEGLISENFFDLNINKKYKFMNGPFTDKIFDIINIQKNNISILIGNLKTTIKREKFLSNPV
tara:strand:+ start:480 stop:977 length:498 start_codon:yes stop_codon:yes gene_type:complete